jgi:hypothetical protein
MHFFGFVSPIRRRRRCRLPYTCTRCMPHSRRVGVAGSARRCQRRNGGAPTLDW